MSVEFPLAVPRVGADTLAFLAALRQAGFAGEASAEYADRLVCSTDNSIYQIVPAAVVYPRSAGDLDRLMRVAQALEHRHLAFYPRGGGTSTNGQSLGGGIVVDTSRHMRRILDFDAARGVVRVEPGLVRDRLNDFLKPYGRFFAPTVSTSNRATIGGMVSNDSSGKGSLVYGKTSDHVEAIEFLLPSGETVEIGRIAATALAGISGTVAEMARRIDELLAPRRAEIVARFPRMRRCFTGYNLEEARSEDGDLNLVKLIAGSEGTLGLIKSVTLRTEPIPAHTVLVVLVYAGHEDGLRAVPHLLRWQPNAIEFVDDKILGAALRSPFGDDVRRVLGIGEAGSAVAAHFFEMSDDDPDWLERRLRAFLDGAAALPDEALRPLSMRVVREATLIARVWEIRSACQGLLAGFEKNKRAVAFIEDSAVPPENLAPFVSDLEIMLRSKNIALGMYGHADVGCVHIRPLMNLSAEDERRQVRLISDAVFELTRKHGGLLWGEHGKGLRGEYSERVIGADLFTAMRRIKAIFDPTNRMNPGKIARPDEAPILALDAPRMRGEFDAQVTAELRETYAGIMRCDGNASCFNQDDGLALCPSYKATGDRRMSPKGRAGLLREWARSRSIGDAAAEWAIAGELAEVLDLCLACKACASAGCPAKVDIPQMKSLFLEWYHAKHRRPLADHLVAALESLAPLVDRFGSVLVNSVVSLRWVGTAIEATLGLIDLPRFRDRRDFHRRLAALGVAERSAADLMRMPAVARSRTIVVVQDCFTSFFEPDVVLAQIELIGRLGFTPAVLAYREGGKPMHVKGFLARFRRVAARGAAELAALGDAGFTLVGVDPATTLMYRHEYPETLPRCPTFTVHLFGEWLQTVDLPKLAASGSFTFIQHCTERSLAPATSGQWARVFAATGLDVRPIRAGCCGMAGVFGHEASHRDLSEALYDSGWRAVVEAEEAGRLVATGYSCRSQIARLSKVDALHPAEVLLAHWPK